MRLPRVSTRRLLVLVAALAVVLGVLTTLQRRRERFRRLSAEYQAAIQAVYIGEDPYLEIPNYHSFLADKYRDAADRPWLPLEADLPQPRGVREFWIAHAAVKKAYPGVALRDYVAQIVADEPDPEDPPGTIDWAVRYRRRDHRSGMNVFVEDPVRIELHEEGRPPDPPGHRSD